MVCNFHFIKAVSRYYQALLKMGTACAYNRLAMHDESATKIKVHFPSLGVEPVAVVYPYQWSHVYRPSGHRSPGDTALIEALQPARHLQNSR
jgi:hypothetical protein